MGVKIKDIIDNTLFYKEEIIAYADSILDIHFYKDEMLSDSEVEELYDYIRSGCPTGSELDAFLEKWALRHEIFS